jgi:DMSO/TMAO reductase YedYZ heme-binding membrane subunit
MGMRAPLWPIGAAAVGVVGIFLATMQLDMTGLERWLLLNRYLARFSFLVFVAIYAASPLASLMPGRATSSLIRIRRSLGLGYALIMAAHVCAIGAYQMTAGSESIDIVAGIGGGAGFVLIGALAATSNDKAMRRLGARNWKRLHTGALHWLWVIYTFTYLGRISEGHTEFIPGLVTVFALLALRLSVRFRVRD